MLKLFAFALSSMLPVAAGAYMDEISDWTSVEVRTVIDRAPVVVAAAVSNNRLSRLVVTMRGKTVSVGAEEFDDLVRPKLNTLKVISPDVKSSSSPSVVVELKVENGSAPLGSPLSTVRFHFGEFKYLGRNVTHQNLVNEIKEPGKPEQRQKLPPMELKR